MTEIITRGGTVFFSFTFYDENGDVAEVDSAELQLTYPGAGCYETEKLTLSQTGDNWTAEWPSAHSRPGFVDWIAVAKSGVYTLTQDGRFRLFGNRASLDHDSLPGGNTVSRYDYNGRFP